MYSRPRRPPTWRSSVTSRPGSRLLPAADASRRVDVTTQGLIGVERVLQLSDAVSPAIGASSLVTLPSRGRRSTTAGAGAPPSECSRRRLRGPARRARARESEVVDNPARVADNPNESRHVRRLSVSQWPTFTAHVGKDHVDVAVGLGLGDGDRAAELVDRELRRRGSSDTSHRSSPQRSTRDASGACRSRSDWTAAVGRTRPAPG